MKKNYSQIISHLHPDKPLRFKNTGEDYKDIVDFTQNDGLEEENRFPLPTQEECDDAWTSTVRPALRARRLQVLRRREWRQKVTEILDTLLVAVQQIDPDITEINDLVAERDAINNKTLTDYGE
jgi:hypothetical protein